MFTNVYMLICFVKISLAWASQYKNRQIHTSSESYPMLFVPKICYKESQSAIFKELRRFCQPSHSRSSEIEPESVFHFLLHDSYPISGQNVDGEMLLPKPCSPQPQSPNTYISGISYIGVLSVAFRPDTRTEKNGSIFKMFCLMMITHIWSWWTLVQVVSNSMIWAIFSLILSMRLDFWWDSWESLVLMNEWELAGLRRTNEWIAMVKKCSVTS